MSHSQRTLRIRPKSVISSRRPPAIQGEHAKFKLLFQGGKMNREEKEDTTIYKVVLNHEEQYSIWPAERENPLGWRDAGKNGQKAECLAYIKEVWTDMRPLSLRKKME